MRPRLVGEADAAEELDGAGPGLGRGEAAHVNGAGRDVVEHGHVREQVEALEHHADLEAYGPDRPVVGPPGAAVGPRLREMDPLDGDGARRPPSRGR